MENVCYLTDYNTVHISIFLMPLMNVVQISKVKSPHVVIIKKIILKE